MLVVSVCRGSTVIQNVPAKLTSFHSRYLGVFSVFIGVKIPPSGSLARGPWDSRFKCLLGSRGMVKSTLRISRFLH